MIYLDYAATNPYTKYPCSKYGRFLNPNANYAYKEKKLLNDCANRVKAAIGAKSGKVVFGGTASQLIENLFGQIGENAIVVGSIYEHDALAGLVNQMDDINGIKNTVQNCPFTGKLIVCLMGVNNVTGQVFPVEEIGKMCKEHGAFFICDMTAMIGHAPIPENLDDWCDCVVYSGHKIATELGIGVMWLSDKFNDWLGDFKLHGTPNLAGAMAIADATEDAVKSVKKNMWHWRDLAELLGGELNKIGILVQEPYFKGERTHAINAIRLNGVNADALQQWLASKQIYIGIGASACAESHDYRVLNSFGLNNKEASEVVRISFSENSNAEDVRVLVSAIKEFKEKFVR